MPKSNLAAEILGTTGVENTPRPKRKPTTRKVKQVFAAEHATPPAGFRWVYNRLTVPYENMFDGMVFAWEPNEYRLIKQDEAYFLWANSIIQYSPVNNKGLRALALDSGPARQEVAESEGYGIPLPPPSNPELIDRTAMPKVVIQDIETTPGQVSTGLAKGTNLPR